MTFLEKIKVFRILYEKLSIEERINWEEKFSIEYIQLYGD